MFKFLVFALFWGSLSWAQLGVEFFRSELHPALKAPVWMQDSIQVQITPRGQKLYAENFLTVLSNLGVVINENYFPALEVKAEKAISISEMAKERPEQFRMVQETRDFISRGIRGIELKDFKPAVKLGPSEYVAEFNRLSIVADEKLMKQIGKTEGAVLSLEFSISQLKALSSDIRVFDEENPWLGEIGVLNPALSVGTRETPLVGRLPFYVKLDKNKELKFEVLDVSANLDSVPIEVSYRKLLLPSFELKVVGQDKVYQISLEDNEFKKIVDAQIPTGLKLVRDYARIYLQKEFPKLINEKVSEALKGELEEIQSLPAAGTPEADPRPPLSLGMKLNGLSLKDSYLGVNLSTFIEDTSIPAVGPALWSKSGARGTPVFNHLPPDQYDLGIAVDRIVFNRLVHLSFNRKNFKSLSVGSCPDSPKIELLNAPAIDAVTNKKSDDPTSARVSASLDILLDSPKNVSSGIFAPLKDKLHLKLKYNAFIRPVSPGSPKLGIYADGPQPGSLWVDDASLTWIGKIAKKKVLSEINKVLSEDGDCGTSGPIAEFELINALWGFPIEYVKLAMDPQGQMMLYMNYKQNSEQVKQ
ncbi:MAG: hypothetical protein ACK5V3_13415 [Bdellovibrionales bacterium]